MRNVNEKCRNDSNHKLQNSNFTFQTLMLITKILTIRIFVISIRMKEINVQRASAGSAPSSSYTWVSSVCASRKASAEPFNKVCRCGIITVRDVGFRYALRFMTFLRF